MAGVNWKKFDCDICLAVALTAAAVVGAVVTLILMQTGLPIWLLTLLVLALWGVLLVQADSFCKGWAQARAASPDVVAPTNTSDAHAAAASAPDEATAKTAADDAAAKAVAEEAAAKVAAEEAAAKIAAEEAAAEEAAAKAKEAAAKVAAEEAAAQVSAEKAAPADFVADDGVAGASAALQAETDADKPELLSAAREGGPDDLKKIKGVGPKLEGILHDMGVFHFDQIASWTAAEVGWVDERLKFKGRIDRDGWIEQAGILATGGETEFSKRK